jgi:hypothetical protein
LLFAHKKGTGTPYCFEALRRPGVAWVEDWTKGFQGRHLWQWENQTREMTHSEYPGQPVNRDGSTLEPPNIMISDNRISFGSEGYEYGDDPDGRCTQWWRVTSGVGVAKRFLTLKVSDVQTSISNPDLWGACYMVRVYAGGIYREFIIWGSCDLNRPWMVTDYASALAAGDAVTIDLVSHGLIGGLSIDICHYIVNSDDTRSSGEDSTVGMITYQNHSKCTCAYCYRDDVYLYKYDTGVVHCNALTAARGWTGFKLNYLKLWNEFDEIPEDFVEE